MQGGWAYQPQKAPFVKNGEKGSCIVPANGYYPPRIALGRCFERA